MNRKLYQAVLQSLQKGTREFSSAKKGAPCTRPHGGSLATQLGVWYHTQAGASNLHCPAPAGPRKVPASQQHSAGAGPQAAPAEKHYVDRFTMGAPGVYMPTAEEAAAIEKRNWLTLGDH
jgi:hypothetical protein